jgi:hypothetical protein
MIDNVVTKATKAMYWLLNFVRKERWNHPHIRLTLADVYVRSIL